MKQLTAVIGPNNKKKGTSGVGCYSSKMFPRGIRPRSIHSVPSLLNKGEMSIVCAVAMPPAASIFM